MLRTDPNFLDFEDELGAIAASASISVKGGKKKKKKGKVGAKVKKAFKKIGKVAAVVATGGLAAAPMIAKKTKLGKKVIAKVKGSKVAGKVKDLLAPAKPTTAKKPAAAKKPAPKKKLPAIAKAVLKTPMSDCSNMEEMAKLVAAKLMVTLGKPLTESNRILAKQDLQNQATYEHKKLMTDADFRRKVLALLAGKAAEGNETCQRTVKVILAK